MLLQYSFEIINTNNTATACSENSVLFKMLSRINLGD
jgi:hypothetical protein